MLKEDGTITFVDVLPNSYLATNKTLDILSEEHIPSIDHYVLMGYRSNTENCLNRFFRNIKVHSIFVPAPKTPEDEMIYQNIKELTEDYNIHLNTFSSNEFLAFGTTKIYITQNYGNQDHHLPIFTIESKNGKHMYVSQGAVDEFSYDLTWNLLSECSTVIFGTKGTNNDMFLNISYLPKEVKTVIISNDNHRFDKEFYDVFSQYGKSHINPKRYRLN